MPYSGREKIVTVKLSICIPTINRKTYLENMLPALIRQAEGNNVEVCVSDNHSDDSTSEYLKLIGRECSFLKFIQQERRLDLDENMYEAIKMGSGAYIYPLGDDDFLPENSLYEIIKELAFSPDLLVLNATHTDAVLDPLRSHLPKQLWGETFEDVLPAFQSLGGDIPGLLPFGAFLAKKELFDYENYQKFFGTSHAYIGCVWDGLVKKNDALIKTMATPTVLLRGGDKTWDDKKAQVMLYEIPKWYHSLPDAYKINNIEYYNKYIRKNFKLYKILRLKLRGEIEEEMYDSVKPYIGKINRMKMSLVKNLNERMSIRLLKFREKFIKRKNF